MNFEEEITSDENRSQYVELKRSAEQLNSQLAAWVGTYDSLRLKVDVTKQSELDDKKTQFIDQLKTTLGI